MAYVTKKPVYLTQRKKLFQIYLIKNWTLHLKELGKLGKTKLKSIKHIETLEIRINN